MRNLYTESGPCSWNDLLFSFSPSSPPPPTQTPQLACYNIFLPLRIDLLVSVCGIFVQCRDHAHGMIYPSLFPPPLLPLPYRHPNLPVIISSSHYVLISLFLYAESLYGVGTTEWQGIIPWIFVAISYNKAANATFCRKKNKVGDT